MKQLDLILTVIIVFSPTKTMRKESVIKIYFIFCLLTFRWIFDNKKKKKEGRCYACGLHGYIYLNTHILKAVNLIYIKYIIIFLLVSTEIIYLHHDLENKVQNRSQLICRTIIYPALTCALCFHFPQHGVT